MNYRKFLLLAMGLSLASPVALAAPGDIVWKLNGYLKGGANLACQASSPATTATKVSNLPVVLATVNWRAQLTLAKDGKFTYWEIDQAAPGAALTPNKANGWNSYWNGVPLTGTWNQSDKNLNLILDQTSTINLFRYYNGGLTPQAPGAFLNFTKQKYTWAGELSTDDKGVTQLKLTEKTLLRIKKYFKSRKKAFPSNRCSTTWHYKKTLRSN